MMKTMNAFLGLIVAGVALSAVGCATAVDEVGEPTSETGQEAKGGVKGRPAKCDYTDPTRTYVSKDPNECMLVKFYCESGQAFFDDCGCGCVNAPTGTGVQCGSAVCGAGEYCCNESCSICAPEGGFCTMQVCEPTPL